MKCRSGGEATQLAGASVGAFPPSRTASWGRQIILRAVSDGYVSERVGGYPGSNKLFSVERNALRKKQLLKPLSLIQRSLHPQVRRSR